MDMSAVITVFVATDEWIKSISVEIVHEGQKMPFLGGYVDPTKGIKYLHASTQTRACASFHQEMIEDQNLSKQTQTVETVHKSQQMSKDIFTQTETKYVYSSTDCDKVIVPRRPYVSADELEQIKLNSVLIIQNALKKWFAKHQLKLITEGIRHHVNWEKIRKEKRDEEAKERQRLEELCNECPYIRKDFDFLFNQLQRWREKEVEKINKATWGPERCAALTLVTDEHIKRIGEIYAKKMVAHSHLKVDNKLAFLNKAAEAKKWKSCKVETSHTLRARELRDLYYTLTLPGLETAERVDALITVIQIVKEHACELSNEIISLAEREMHLLERRIKQINLRALHRRIITLFWEYISQPAFNPEAANASIVYQNPMILRQHLICCKSCGTYFTRVPIPGKADCTETPIYLRSRQNRCSHCIQLENEARRRVDAQIFQRMLAALWKKERHLGVTSGLIFFLKKTDIAYIVEKVWKSKSPISGNTNVKELVLTRWDRYREWLPWNAILLTYTEADAHDNLNNLEEVYDPEFILDVKMHLSTAYAHFVALPRILPYISGSFIQEITSQNCPNVNDVTASVHGTNATGSVSGTNAASIATSLSKTEGEDESVATSLSIKTEETNESEN